MVFFSLVQPGIIFPSLGEERFFFILAAVAGVVYFFKNKPIGKMERLPQNLFIYGMVVAYTLSEAQYLWLSGTLAVFLFWFKKAFLYYLIIHSMTEEKELKWVIWSILLGSAVLIGYGWNIYWYEANVYFGDRLTSVGNYNNPNSFALLLTLIFPLGFSMVEIERNGFKKLILILFMILVVISCLYTKSRGGTLGMLFAVSLSFLFSQRMFGNNRIKVILLTIIPLLFVTYGIRFILLRPDVDTFMGMGGEASAGDRLMAWVAGFKMFMKHPLFGIGWNNFVENALLFGMDKKIPAHNTFLSILAETGLFGFLCFLALNFKCYQQIMKVRNKWASDLNNNELIILTNGIMISFFCFFINSFFSVKGHDPIYWNILLLIGLLVIISSRYNKEKDKIALQSFSQNNYSSLFSQQIN